MNRTSLVAKIWIGFGLAAALTAVLGGLAAYAAASQSTGWAAAAIVLAALAVLGTGAVSAASASGALGALAAEVDKVGAGVAAGKLGVRADADALPRDLGAVAERTNGTVEQLVRAVEVMADALARLAKGELPPPAADRQAGDLSRVREAVNAAGAAVGALLEDVQLAAGGAEAKLDGRHGGRFLESLRSAAAARATLLERCHWYEQILDAIPFPLSVTDRDMRWTFVNAPVEKLLGVKRKDVLGKACENWNADICRTENCGVARLRKGQLETRFKQQGMNFRVDTAYLKNLRGETVGHVEVVQDVTPLVRVSEYQRDELSKLSRTLARLASGDVAVDAKVGEADAHTREAREEFLGAAASLEQVRAAIGAVVRDAGQLAAAAVAGRLGERVDPQVHQGEFRKLVEGFNQTLDAVMAPVNEAARALEQLARRDLRARVTGAFAGDHARIKESVNAAAEALHDALTQVSDAVEQVSSASAQIAASSQAVASGASEQASSLQETSTSIESVAGMTKQSADNAQQANHLATAARGAASEGTAAVEQMQAAMSRIKASAEGTSQIIRDINDIAFQTNLLALNAAVEAARAGEAGRGFAVVAEEVRSLALRAKEAAQKTEELIRQSVKEAGDGEVTARQVAGKLGEIAGGISKVNDIISEIAAGAKEQASGIDQVNRAVAEMDKVTQQNAASAEESSSAASELSGQAEELAAMIGAFRLERSSGRAAAAPRLAAPAPVRAGPTARAARLPAAAPKAEPKGADELFPMDDAGGVRDF